MSCKQTAVKRTLALADRNRKCETVNQLICSPNWPKFQIIGGVQFVFLFNGDACWGSSWCRLNEGGAKVHHLSVCVSSCDAAAVYWCPHREWCDHWCCRLNVRIWSARLARRLYLLLPSSSSSFSPFSWCFILNCWIKLRPNLCFLALALSLSAGSEHWCTLIAPFISSSQLGVSAGWVGWWRSVSPALLTLSSDFTRWPTRARMSATWGVQPEQLESMRGGDASMGALVFF